MSASQRYFITTAISYPNGLPHIGHAYELISTDAMARFMRLDGKDVRFLTGVDVHGLKMFQKAKELGISARELAEQNTPPFRDMGELVGSSHDDFISTLEPRHYDACQEIWRRMAAAGDIYKDRYAGWYSVRDEAYYSEDESHLNEDGVRVGPQGTPVDWTEEESYFFRLSAYQDKLLALFESHPEFIGPAERRNEIISFVKSGLKDLSISRTTFDWGVPVPDDPDHVMYVWVDALTNYISALGYPDQTNPLWHYWPADVHIIGKDIIRFHAVYWPAFLMSAGVPLPKRVFAHGFLFNRGEKMSKSLGNVVGPNEMIDLYGQDQLRFFLLREIVYGRDGNYSHDAIVARINADLANDIGNLASRSLSMIAKNCAEQLPEPGEFTAEDQALLAAADGLLEACRGHMAQQHIHLALADIWQVVAEANRYFAGQEPWALRKTDPARMQTVLYVTAEVIRQVAILAQPAVPVGANKLLDLLSVPEDARQFDQLGAGGRLAPGVAILQPSPVFPRFVDDPQD